MNCVVTQSVLVVFYCGLASIMLLCVIAVSISMFNFHALIKCQLKAKKLYVFQPQLCRVCTHVMYIYNDEMLYD